MTNYFESNISSDVMVSYFKVAFELQFFEDKIRLSRNFKRTFPHKYKKSMLFEKSPYKNLTDHQFHE